LESIMAHEQMLAIKRMTSTAKATAPEFRTISRMALLEAATGGAVASS
jgi:hypothetical protein